MSTRKSSKSNSRAKTGSSRRTHGQTDTAEYTSWVSMKQRCFNPNSLVWDDYGGRGITVCSGWVNSSISFLADMGPKPPGAVLDRKNNDGNYSCGRCDECLAKGWPFNARWTDQITSSNNRRTSLLITYDGETRGLRQWAKVLGVPYKLLWKRLRKLKWSAVRAFTEASGSAQPTLLTFEGKTMSTSAWARHVGLSPFALWFRLNKLGWELERALTTPSQAAVQHEA